MFKLLLLAALAFSQQEEAAEIKGLGTCGLTTRYASTQIRPECLSEASNVYLDEDLGITRRTGFGQYNSTALTDSQPVRGFWPFRASDGTDYQVVLSSETMYQSNGRGTYTAIPGLNDMSLTQDMDCAQCLGKLFCVNGSDTMFSWNGSSTDTYSGAPTCQAIDCFRNRVVLGNCSGAVSQLYLSGELDGGDYTIPTFASSTSPAQIPIGGVNDGNRLKCVMGTYQDTLMLGKEDSLSGLYGFDRRDFAVREFSREIGCIDNRSVKEKQGSLYWLSKRGVEKMTGPSIVRVSDPIRDLVETIIEAGGNSRSAIDSTQAEFEAGNLRVSGAGAPLSATINPGNVVVSTWGVTITTSSLIEASFLNIDTRTTPGSIILSSSSFRDDFSDSDFLSGQITWTTTGWSHGSGYMATNSSVNAATTTEVNITSGSWQFQYKYTQGGSPIYDFCNSGTNLCIDFKFITKTNGDFYSLRLNATASNSTQALSIVKSLSGTETVLAGTTVIHSDGVWKTYRIVRSADASIFAYQSDVLISSASDASLGSPSFVAVVASQDLSSQYIRDFYAYQYASSGTALTQIYDTSFSTPVGGAFRSTFTAILGETSVDFFVRQSTSPNNDFWTDWTATSDTLHVFMNRRYQQGMVRLFTSPAISTKTPSVSEMSLSAATTGYFISSCKNPGSGITSFGLFQCNRALNGGSITFAVTTGASCNAVTSPAANWTAQTNNSGITLGTADYIAYRALFTVDSATQTPTLNDCTINWNEGTTRPSVAAEVYKDRYYLAYSSGTSGDVVNDTILVLDSRDQWALHDAPNCASLGLYNRKLYCGASANSGLVYQMDLGLDDAGASFTSSFKTKDFDFGNPFQKKKLSRIFYDLAGLPSPAYDITLTPSYGLDTSTDTVTLEDIDLSEDYSRFIAAKAPADASKNTSGRWFNFGLSHQGDTGPWKVYALKILFTRLRED